MFKDKIYRIPLFNVKTILIINLIMNPIMGNNHLTVHYEDYCYNYCYDYKLNFKFASNYPHDCVKCFSVLLSVRQLKSGAKEVAA